MVFTLRLTHEEVVGLAAVSSIILDVLWNTVVPLISYHI